MAIDERLIGALHLTSGGASEELGAGHRAFQASTLRALLDGAYDGDVTFAELARRGDFGIGTLNGCDGEMIALDGRFLRADVEGEISEVPPEARTPFAVLTFFEPRHRLAVPPGAGFDELCATIDAQVGEEAIVHAIRAEGRFTSVRCRSVPKQSKPYRPLAEVIAGQRVFDLTDLHGSMVGFRFPSYLEGIEVGGYHLHFIDADRSRGGHVLGSRSTGLRARLDPSKDLHIELPPQVDLADPDLAGATHAAVERIERG